MDEAPSPPALFEPHLLTRIARELAQETYPLEQILVRYDIDQEYFDTKVAPNPYFQKVHSDYVKEWESIGSTHRRLAFAAAASLEENLPVLADRMGSRASGLADAVATAKLFKELAGIATPAPSNAQQGSAFSIRIDFGSHKVSLDAIKPEAKQIEEEKLLEAPKSDGS